MAERRANFFLGDRRRTGDAAVPSRALKLGDDAARTAWLAA